MIENIFEITLSMSAVIIAVLLFSPIIEKRYSAKWRYFIWLFIAIRLIIPFNITLPKAPINIETPRANVYLGTNVKPETNVNINIDDMATQNKNPINPTVAQSNTNNRVEVSMIDIIQNIWILGVILFIGYNLINYGLFRNHIKKKAKEVEIEIASDVKKEIDLKLIPKIVVSNEVLSPMLVGFVKPMVILPEIKYSNNELKVILKHEFMHYKRKDLWYKLLLIIANGMHWFNPIVYFMVRKANRDLEYSCDDDVVKNENMEYRKDYSMTILKSMENSRATALSTYLSKSGENEKKRFKNILESKSKKRGLITLIISLIGIIIIGIFITVSDFSEAIITRSGPAEINKIPKLIADICSSPSTASNPYTYIAEHQSEFDELVSLDKEALVYMFTEFEKGNQSGLEGHIMKEACIEILGDEIFSGSFSTGQEWYEMQRNIANQYLTDESKKEEFKILYPKLSTILEVMNKYERKPMTPIIRGVKNYSEKPSKESVNIILEGKENEVFIHDVNLQAVQYALNDIGVSEIYLNDKRITKNTTFICAKDENGNVYVDGAKMKAPFKFEIFDGTSSIFDNDVIINMISDLEKYSIKVTLEK